MRLHKWSDIRAKKFSSERLRRMDEEIEEEIPAMDLRALREAVGLTQEELARKVEVTQRESGDRPVSKP